MRVGYCYLPSITDFVAGPEPGGRQPLQKIRAISFEILPTVATGQRVLVGKLVIDLEFVVIDPLLIVSLGEVVIVALVRIEHIYRRQRIKIEQLL